MRMPALAVTDRANLFALVGITYKAAQAKGIKPLVGVDVLLREACRACRTEPPRVALPERPRLPESDPARHARLPLEDRARRGPTLARAWLDADSTGARSPCRGHGTATSAAPILARARRRRGARAGKLARVVRRPLLPRVAAHRAPGRGRLHAGSLQLAVARRAGRRDQRRAAPAARRLRGARSARLHPGRSLLADASRSRRYSEEQYLRTPDEMASCSPTCPKRSRTPVETRPAHSTWS